MDTPQHPTRVADQHLREAARILTQQHDCEDAREPLTLAAFEAFGRGPHLRAVVALLMRAMASQRDADQHEIAQWGRK
jgi:hypothetical protein